MKVLDLFCGAGGVSLGFHREGFEIIAVDSWHWACESYKYNFPDHELIRSRIEDLNGNFTSREVDVVWASPPCQTFSLANRARSVDTTLLDQTWKLIDELKPLFWLVENVRGAPYSGTMYNAMDFGVPQMRWRKIGGSYREPRKDPYQGNDWVYCVMASEWKGSSSSKGASRSLGRQLTISEMRHYQSFPIDFVVKGHLRERYVLLGNAVPPLFAQAFAHALRKGRGRPRKYRNDAERMRAYRQRKKTYGGSETANIH